MDLPSLGETRRLDERAKKQAPGIFASLDSGFTHYALGGPVNGDPIVFLHGIAGPMQIWTPIAAALEKIGYRVLQYDLLGRGFSERRKTTYDIGLFIRQLDELLIELHLSAPLTLVGWSLGGMIATLYTKRFPSKIGRLVLISPVGIIVDLPPISRIGMTPIAGEILMSLFGQQIVRRSLTKGISNQELIPTFLDLLTEQMKFKGYLAGFLSTLRNCAYRDASEDYQALGSIDIPALLISGEKDTFIPPEAIRKIISYAPHIEHHTIRNAGHSPHFEYPAEVISIIKHFLISTQSRGIN